MAHRTILVVLCGECVAPILQEHQESIRIRKGEPL